MRVIAGLAAGVAAGALLAVSTPTSASAAPPDQWWTDIFKLDQVHKTNQGEGATVCVIDSAVNADVPEFDGADLQLKSAATADDDKLVKAKSYPSAFYADHGTSMTSLIIGQGKGTGPGGSGIAGMAPKATVYFYQADSDPTTLKLDNSDYNLLINKGLDDGCDLFSISIDNASIYSLTLERVNEEGAVMLFGGRNTSEDSGVDGSMRIGASDRQSKPWDDEAQPLYPDVITPGVDIISGATKGTATNARWVSDITNSGSSDATAITAGVMALVKSRYPDATGNQLIQALIHSGGGKDYWASTTDLGWGPISLSDMLARDPSGWPDINPMLMRDSEVYDTFPESVWKDPNAKPAADEQDRTKAPDANLAADDQSNDGGLPGWAWVVGGIILVGAAGTATVVTRRRTTSSNAPRTGA